MFWPPNTIFFSFFSFLFSACCFVWRSVACGRGQLCKVTGATPHKAKPDQGQSWMQLLGQRSIITHSNGQAGAGTRLHGQQAQHVADWEGLFRFHLCYFSLTKCLQHKGQASGKKQFTMKLNMPIRTSWWIQRLTVCLLKCRSQITFSETPVLLLPCTQRGHLA